MEIVKPVTADGLCGFDQFNQFVVGVREDGGMVAYSFVYDVRNRICRMCERGWDLTSESLIDQATWEVLGRTAVVHQSCLYRYTGFAERETVWKALVGRIRFSGMEEIPNLYWPSTKRFGWSRFLPWYQVELLDHPYKFLIGRRKRVWEISLRPVSPDTQILWYPRVETAFAAENVTKSFGPHGLMVHAWTDLKLLEYIERLVVAGDIGIKRTEDR